MGGISIWQLLIVLVIVLLLFGTKKLKNIGTDLGAAVKGFKGAVTDGQKDQDEPAEEGEPAQLQEASSEASVADDVNETKREGA